MRITRLIQASGRKTILGIALLLAASFSWASNSDWPTHGGDYQRSAASSEGVTLPLAPAWTHQPLLAPEPAWPAPATANRSAGEYGLSPTLTYDRAFHAVSADGRVYYGSSAEDTIVCLDAQTGRPQWTFPTQAPVRLAPTLADGRLYAGSDDGFLYCLDAADGSLVWKYRGGPEDRRLPGNERMISLWPIRCGVVVEEGLVYCTAGIFPLRGVYLCAVDAKTGETAWRKKLDTAPQGYLLASPTRLFIPTGRTPFRAYDRKTGDPLAQFGKSDSWGRDLVGGSHAILIDKTIATGPSEDGQIHLFDATTKERLVSTPGVRMIADGPIAYILRTDRVTAMNREDYVRVESEIRNATNRKTNLDKSLSNLEKELGKNSDDARLQVMRREQLALAEKNSELTRKQRAAILWEKKCDTHHSMILLGDTLFTGGEDKVVARSTKDGEIVWEGAVEGKAYGLARSGDSLLVSTDRGAIHCFAKESAPPPSVDAPKNAFFETPFGDDELTPKYIAAVLDVLRLADVEKGYCLVLNSNDGALAWEIARRSNLQVIIAMNDPKKAEWTSRLIGKTDLYGKRLAVHCFEGGNLPYPDYFANIVMIDGIAGPDRLVVDAKEALRVLRPNGGVIAVAAVKQPEIIKALKSTSDLEWNNIANRSVNIQAATRPPLPGAGEWTHMYANSGGTACSEDPYVKGEMELQWFGRPGPLRMVDRHQRTPSPLAIDGRLFINGMDYIAGVDAYNGTVLWERDMPNSARTKGPRNTSNMVADKNGLYVAAAGECVRFEPRSGREMARFKMPGASAKAEWKYLALNSSRLFGCFTDPKTNAPRLEKEKRETASTLCSDALFALDAMTGEKIWAYRPRGGAVVDTSISVDAGRVVFVESANPDSLKSAKGEMPLGLLVGKGAELVGLDDGSGKELWRKPLDLKSFWYILHLSMAKDTIMLTGSNHVVVEGKGERTRYEQLAFDAATGKQLWQTTQTPTPDRRADGHGIEWQHPAIVGDIMYGPGFANHLRTGKPYAGWQWAKDRKCGTVSMSAHTAFSRSEQALNPYAFDLETGKKQPMTVITRPGCWINMIPACGLVLIPEASSGCTCGHPYSIQTSLALKPKG